MEKTPSRLLILSFVAVLGVVALVSPACVHPPATLSPAGQTAFTADQVVLRVNELENAAMDASAKSLITVPQARVIVAFCVDADKTLKVLPSGWRVSLQQAWTLAKVKISLPAGSAVAGAVTAVDLVLGVL